MRGAGLQNAMTSSEERTSAEAEGYRIERSLMDCVAPVSKGGDAIHQCPRADSWLLRGGFRPLVGDLVLLPLPFQTVPFFSYLC